MTVTTEIPGLDCTVGDLTSVAECDDARAWLIEEVAKIEHGLAEEAKEMRAHNRHVDPDWVAGAKPYLRRCKAALQALQDWRAEIRRKERAAAARTSEQRLLAIIRELDPQLVERAAKLARERFPEVFAGAAG